MIAHKRRRAEPAEDAALVQEVWDRFLAAWAEAYGNASAEELDAETMPSAHSRAIVMGHRIRHGRPPGFRPSSYLEAARLGLDGLALELAPPAASSARRGTWERVEVLAARYAAGEDLWSEGDSERSLD